MIVHQSVSVEREHEALSRIKLVGVGCDHFEVGRPTMLGNRRPAE